MWIGHDPSAANQIRFLLRSRDALGGEAIKTTPTKVWKYPELEYPRSGHAFVRLSLDIDSPNSLEFLAGLLHYGKIPLWNWLVLNELKGELVNQGHIHSFCFSFEWSLCGQTSVPFNQSHQVLIGPGLGLGA